MWNRRNFIRSTVAGCTVLSSGVLSASVVNNTTKLTILHTNDIHSRIDPFPLNDKRNGGKGGFENIAALVKRIREQEQNVLLLDAGDYFQGTPYFNNYNGELELKLFEMLEYDAITIGNHEFDKGLENLLTQYNKVDVPVLSANYIFPSSWNKRVQPFKIFNCGDVKVGVFGIGVDPQGLISEKNFEGVAYRQPLMVANDMSLKLKEAGCHFVIALTHIGISNDMKLAQQTTGIDLIIGGHSHTFLKEPKVVLNKEGHHVLINQVGYGGLHVGRIDFFFNEKGEHF